VHAIVGIADPDLIILFGSHAQGTAREDSDVDLMVVAEAESGAHLGVALEDAVEPLLSPRALDLLVVQARDWPRTRRVIGFVTHEADRHGVKLYERAA
jgi:predicted nucleotidyltransferase